jgi:hypothetical protein
MKKSGIRYPSEFKSFSVILNRRYLVRSYEIAEALGCSTRTVWKWIVSARENRKLSRKGWRRRYLNAVGGYVEPHVRGKIKPWGRPHAGSTELIREAYRRLLRWIWFRRNGGFLDLEACARGEEPP